MKELPQDTQALLDRAAQALAELVGAASQGTVDGARLLHPSWRQQLAEVQLALDAARRRIAAEGTPQPSPARLTDFVGQSAAAREVRRQARRVAYADATVLLLGEPGSGKRLLARAIHAASRRAARPLVCVAISGVAERQLEEELFGEAASADSVGPASRPGGKLAQAHGGTLFLDDIADLSMTLQARLVTVLQAQSIEPPVSDGDAEPWPAARLIAATCHDLGAMVAAGTFRADLFYRLHVLPIRLPPLRDRAQDLEPLAEVLLEDIARRGGVPPKGLTADALQALMRHTWPGNVRELRRVLEAGCLSTDEPALTPRGLRLAPPDALAQPDTTPPPKLSPPPAAASAGESPTATLPARKAALERAAIAHALQRTNGNRMAAARLLAISRATLYEKLSKYPDLDR